MRKGIILHLCTKRILCTKGMYAERDHIVSMHIEVNNIASMHIKVNNIAFMYKKDIFLQMALFHTLLYYQYQAVRKSE